MADNVKPFPTANKPKPQRPELNLVPFQHKDPNALIARLERERTVLEDKLADAQAIITALDTYVRQLEAYAGLEPAEPPAQPEPAAD